MVQNYDLENYKYHFITSNQSIGLKSMWLIFNNNDNSVEKTIIDYLNKIDNSNHDHFYVYDNYIIDSKRNIEKFQDNCCNNNDLYRNYYFNTTNNSININNMNNKNFDYYDNLIYNIYGYFINNERYYNGNYYDKYGRFCGFFHNGKFYSNYYCYNNKDLYHFQYYRDNNSYIGNMNLKNYDNIGNDTVNNQNDLLNSYIINNSNIEHNINLKECSNNVSVILYYGNKSKSNLISRKEFNHLNRLYSSPYSNFVKAQNEQKNLLKYRNLNMEKELEKENRRKREREIEDEESIILLKSEIFKYPNKFMKYQDIYQEKNNYYCIDNYNNNILIKNGNYKSENLNIDNNTQKISKVHYCSLNDFVENQCDNYYDLKSNLNLELKKKMEINSNINSILDSILDLDLDSDSNSISLSSSSTSVSSSNSIILIPNSKTDPILNSNKSSNQTENLNLSSISNKNPNSISNLTPSFTLDSDIKSNEISNSFPASSSLKSSKFSIQDPYLISIPNSFSIHKPYLKSNHISNPNHISDTTFNLNTNEISAQNNHLNLISNLYWNSEIYSTDYSLNKNYNNIFNSNQSKKINETIEEIDYIEHDQDNYFILSRDLFLTKNKPFLMEKINTKIDFSMSKIIFQLSS